MQNLNPTSQRPGQRGSRSLDVVLPQTNRKTTVTFYTPSDVGAGIYLGVKGLPMIPSLYT